MSTVILTGLCNILYMAEKKTAARDFFVQLSWVVGLFGKQIPESAPLMHGSGALLRKKREYRGKICRCCINETYHTCLFSTDCMYGIYPAKCARCGEVKNIVIGLRLSGYLKSITK